MTTENPTMADRIAEHAISLAILSGPTRRALDGSGRRWEHDAYRVRLVSLHGEMETDWRAGTAFEGQMPDVADVLDALASDAASWAGATDVLDFASELGYDLDTTEDRQRARETFDACALIYRQLAELLGGDDARDALLYETERQ